LIQLVIHSAASRAVWCGDSGVFGIGFSLGYSGLRAIRVALPASSFVLPQVGTVSESANHRKPIFPIIEEPEIEIVALFTSSDFLCYEIGLERNTKVRLSSVPGPIIDFPFAVSTPRMKLWEHDLIGNGVAFDVDETASLSVPLQQPVAVGKTSADLPGAYPLGQWRRFIELPILTHEWTDDFVNVCVDVLFQTALRVIHRVALLSNAAPAICGMPSTRS
jgi:hypothetical protein